MNGKKKKNLFTSALAIIFLIVICLVFFIFQNKELTKKEEKMIVTNEIDPSQMGWTEISKHIEKEDEIGEYVVRAVRDIFSKYMEYIYEENEEAILEVNSSGNTYIEPKDAKKYEIGEIFGKQQNYSYTFFISCNYLNTECYYLIDMDTSNKTFKFKEIDKETFLSAKNGSVSEKYDYSVFIKKGEYNRFKFYDS